VRPGDWLSTPSIPVVPQHQCRAFLSKKTMSSNSPTKLLKPPTPPKKESRSRKTISFYFPKQELPLSMILRCEEPTTLPRALRGQCQVVHRQDTSRFRSPHFSALGHIFCGRKRNQPCITIRTGKFIGCFLSIRFAFIHKLTPKRQ
jgi:hypothetical protein